MSCTIPTQTIRIIIVGEGGQGIQTIAKLFAQASSNFGYHATYIPNFGTEQRGGLSLSFITISKNEIVSPKFTTSNVFIITSSRNIERSLRYISPQSNVIYDSSLVNQSVVDKIKKKTGCILPADAFKIATEKFSERSFNIILLGLLTGIIDKELVQDIQKLMDKKFGKYYQKNESLKKNNDSAFLHGISLTK
ncbi:2-oxoacid:acceptor oxidoreductase family protein [Candidatus Dojkabacteria bacterium]|nr:2-oxoacid:acceptor oxidoreductase family protein [Candidatus Dojkabacteria bacterium]